MSDEFKLPEDFVQQHKLSDEQTSALVDHVTTSYIPNLKKGWDDLANKNAEGIISGAAKYAAEKLGVDIEREQGEKFADYLTRISDKGFEKTKTELEKKQVEIEEKLKNFKGGDEYKQQLETLKSEKDELLKQVAELEPLKGLDEKYEASTKQLGKLKRDVAYGSVKPSFPDTVNKYEADAKWNEFVKGVEEKYNLEIVEGVATAIDKENHHKQVKLSDLVTADKNIAALLEGRKQSGTGSDPAEEIEVEGLPFKVKKGATSEEISKLANEHLVKKLGSSTHQDYAKQFSELYAKMKKASV